MKDQRIKAGTIGVDAGICWIGDPCYILHKDKNPESIGENWNGFCNKLNDQYIYEEQIIKLSNGETVKHTFPRCKFDRDGYKQFEYDGGHAGLGVVVSTGYGDGVYPVYIEKNKDGRVARVIVEFDGDNDENY